MKAKVKSDTLFKLQPVISSELADAAKLIVPAGSEYELKHFTEADNQHLRLELSEAPPGQFTAVTWYVLKSDVDVLGAGATATVLQDTVLKRRPLLSGELEDTEKRFVSARREFALQSYAPAANHHLKLVLAADDSDDDSAAVWYVNADDIRILGQNLLLNVISDTLFKAKPILSSQLAPTDKTLVLKGRTFGLQSYSEAEGGYLKVILAGSTLGNENRIAWYVFAADIEIEGTEPHNQPQDSNPAGRVRAASDRGIPIQLPGFQGTYYGHDPIIAGGYFTWGQATHGGTRIPASVDVIYGIIRIAEALEEIRIQFGNRPIEVVSWYRDPATNLRVGGTKNSRHLTGDGVNFVVDGVPADEVYAQLDAWWGASGGLASAAHFTHIDARGYRARWAYNI